MSSEEFADTVEGGMAWIAHMNASLARQQELLKRLLEEVSSENVYRFLLVSCSLARDAGDELSDVDAEMGISDDVWPGGIEAVKKMTKKLGTVVDQIDYTMPIEMGHERRHIITVFEGNLQLSLVVTPSSWVPGLKPNAVALYDPDGRLAQAWDPPMRKPSSQQVREWAFLSWLDLADAAKYLKRGSLWEALERLHRARNRTWQLWAVAQRVDFALYGITQLLDDEVKLPAGIENSVAMLDKAAILDACLALADVLEHVTEAANGILPFELPQGMQQTAQRQLLEV